MLDAAEAGPGGPGHAGGGVGVAGDVPAGVGGLLDERGQLVPGVLQRAEPVGRRADPAGDHDLDKVGAAAQLVPGGLPDRVHAVGDPGQPVAGAGVPVVAGLPGVAVPAGLADRVAAEEQPRPGIVPSATAAARPASAPPASRTVVNPRCSIASSSPAHFRAVYDAGRRGTMPRSACQALTCTCASMSPGSTVRPRTSGVWAPRWSPRPRVGRRRSGRRRRPPAGVRPCALRPRRRPQRHPER